MVYIVDHQRVPRLLICFRVYQVRFELSVICWDILLVEPESLILAQNERWRQA